jgi:molybdopterin-guanine dinucleotide biosynthesis protein A
MLGREGGSVNGYLLAGGRSSRYGSDKRLAVLDGIAIGVRAAESLRRAVMPDGEVFAVGPPGARLAELGLPWLDDDAPGGGDAALGLGPCAGLWTVTQRGGGLVLACDMPLVPASTLQVLPHLGGARPAAPMVAGRLLPLCGWWPAGAADALAHSLAGGGGRATEAFWAAGGIAVSLKELGLRDDDAWLFESVNTPYDLGRLTTLVNEQGGLWT